MWKLGQLTQRTLTYLAQKDLSCGGTTSPSTPSPPKISSANTGALRKHFLIEINFRGLHKDLWWSMQWSNYRRNPLSTYSNKIILLIADPPAYSLIEYRLTRLTTNFIFAFQSTMEDIQDQYTHIKGELFFYIINFLTFSSWEVWNN